MIAILLTLGFVFFSSVSFGAEVGEVVFWHNQDTVQAKFLESLVAQFNKQNSTKVKVETGVSMQEALLIQVEQKKSPQVAWCSSDLIGLYRQFKLSEVPDSAQGSKSDEFKKLVTIKGKSYGIPTLGGNHLLLFFNKTLVKKPAQTWEEMKVQEGELSKKGVKVIGWPYEEPYYFLPFLNALGGWPLSGDKVRLDTPEMRRALEVYKKLSQNGDIGVVPPNCDFECNSKRFYKGEFAYALQGDWALLEAKRALGNSLGVTKIPALGGLPVKSIKMTQSLIFPAKSLNGPHREVLMKFAEFLRGKEIQKRWYLEMMRIPVNAEILKASGVTSMTKLTPELIEDVRVFNNARAISNSGNWILMWPAIQRGLQLYLSGVKNAEEATRFMQEMAENLIKKAF